MLCLALWVGWPAWLAAQQSTAELASGRGEMIGQVAPPWKHQGWVNSKPVDLAQLRGKVILLRFFQDHAAGAAAVRELYQTYGAQGLAVVGFYVPTPFPAETEPEQVRQLASALGFEFPVGVDARWETINRYWLNRAEAEMAAATFVIDRQGIIRYIQPDGLYEKNSSQRALRREYDNLVKQIEGLLKEAGEAAANEP